MTLNPRRCFAAGALCLLLTLAAVPARAAEAPPLTLEQIMADPDWIGNPPTDPYWSDDGRALYYERERDGVGANPKDLFRVDLATGKVTRIEPADRGKADAPGGDWTRDRKKKVYARAGDIFVKDIATGSVRQITRTAEEEAKPFFLADGKRVGFYQDKKVFVYDLSSGLLSQPAELRLEKDPAEEDEPSLLAAEQTRLFDVIRQEQERKRREREEKRANQQADPTRPPLPWYLGKDVTIEEVSLSPAGDWLAVVTASKRSKSKLKPAKLPRYVTESGNVDTRDVRAKVGTEAPLPHSVILLDLARHERHDLDLAVLPGIQDDPLKTLREAAEARKAAVKKKKRDEKKSATAAEEQDTEKDAAAQDEDEGKDEGESEDKGKDAKGPKLRPLEVLALVWSDDGRQLAVQLRARDNKDRWIATYATESRQLTLRHRLTDPAWINWGFNDIGWLPGSDTLWFLSEETGFSQLYLLPVHTGEKRLLTPPGPYEVTDVVPSRDGRSVYYSANREHPGKYDTWRVDVATGKAEQLTRLGGLTDFRLSPDESQLLLLHSALTRPDEVYVQPTRPGAEARQVTHTRTEAFLAQDWTVPEVLAIPSTHGAPAPIYSRVYTPAGFDPARNRYPAVVFVHGAGYLQNAHYGWSNYFREFMFHTFLTRHGYVVLDMDYRASAGYGRDWRTAIYRQMGHPELEDLQDGVAWLTANKGVDPRRVGVYGGSYGGFMTFMALFRAPDLFAAGAALRPVTDWAHYNEEYTSNILNRPEIDPEAYEKSSPIEYAAGLQKPLLICHGMQDANVFFQDTVRLVQRLIELKKQNFETAFYPVEDHGFVQPTSWLDEYRRVFKLFETYVRPEPAEQAASR
jgi:dipeptidyl aminopeptidase/acylaminoacyl peptidase